MYEFHVWLYEHAPNWSADRWEWVVLGVGIAGLLWRFMAARTKNKLDDKASVVFDIAEAEVRNLRNRARAKEINESK